MDSGPGIHLPQKALLSEPDLEDRKCAVCSDSFKDPKLLDCLHTFCESCLRKFVGANEIFCPTCKKPTKQKVGGNEKKIRKEGREREEPGRNEVVGRIKKNS